MLMIRVNVQFVYGEIIHRIRKSNYTVMKQPLCGNSTAKKILQKKLIYRSYHAQPMDPFNGMDPLDNFYTDHPCVD